LQAIGWEAAFFRPFIPYTFAPVEPDILIDQNTDLVALGFDPGTRILHTPGHSAGSVTLIFADQTAITGDIVRGGMIGGRLNPGRPFKPYFMPSPADYKTLYGSVKRVLESGAHTWHVGHGGPLRAADVRTWLAKAETEPAG
jgi:glyoxylase-like metal-dependent hydrolase (beta-lactamase superfamily II)